MSGFAPKKQFSQNFLTDPKTADKIVAALEAESGDCVVEIGPGAGMLTQRLVRTGAHIHAVEIDARAAAHIAAEPWSKSPLLEVHLTDILNLKVEQICGEGECAKVIGNIPYAITSDILFWLFEQRRTVKRAVIMMQREVAQRLVAQPRSKEYGVLSVATWFASEPKILFHVKPGSFFPKPSVTSSVVLFQFRTADPIAITMSEFMGFVRAAFSQRRKVLSNSLKSYISMQSLPEGAGQTSINLGTTRAEELSPLELFDVYQSLRATT